MRNVVRLAQYAALPSVNAREVYRYAGGKGEPDEEFLRLLESCEKECLPQLTCRVCYTEFSAAEFFERFGKCKLTENYLQGCEKTLVFAATLGLGVDRLISRYVAVSPVKALTIQALGAERIERLCDEFCNERLTEYQAQGLGLTPRFSAGYGDFPLSAQTEFFALLDCSRKIGLTLNDRLLMSPSKSVTAAVGILKR